MTFTFSHLMRGIQANAVSAFILWVLYLVLRVRG